jgi:adenylosuccinate synthase
MSATVVVGAQYGDEGKGRIVDWLAERFRHVVRYNGGPNAGHTVVNDFGAFKLHQVPSGIFNPMAACYIGNGAVVSPTALANELTALRKREIPLGCFHLSHRAHLIMPWHVAQDRIEEALAGKSAIGTTGQGIGPCYAEKASRTGFRVEDLVAEGFWERFVMARLRKRNDLKRLYPNARFGDLAGSDDREAREEHKRLVEALAPHVTDVGVWLRAAWKRGEPILLEGAQAAHIDIENGAYPYVSSSVSTSAGACVGSGLPPKAIRRVIAVAKAYTTRVGKGPLPTELPGPLADELREAGKEFGTTTGRPRRCGWFDAYKTREACEINGADAVVLTKLDVLSSFKEITVAVDDSDGPDYAYEKLPGWNKPIDGCRRWRDLPASARRYVERLEEAVGTPIAAVSVGPERGAIIVRKPAMLR